MWKIFRNNYSTFDTVADAKASGMKVGQKYKIYGYHTRGDGYQRKGVVVELSGQTIDNGKYHLMANGNVLDIYLPAQSTFSTIIWGVDTTQSDNGTRLNAMAEYLHSRTDIAAGYSVKFPSQTINVDKEVIWRTRNDQIVNFNGNGVKLVAPSQNVNVFSLNGDLLPENWWKYHPTEANVGADLLADLQAADANPETRIDAIYTLLNNRGTDGGDRAYTEPNAFTDAQFPMGHPHFKEMKFQGGRNGLTVVSSYGGSTEGCLYTSNRDSGERLIFALMFKSEKNLATNNTNESFVARDGGLSYRFKDNFDTITIVEPRTFKGYSQCNSTEYASCRVYNATNAKSSFKDYGNSTTSYDQCVSEGGSPLTHFMSLGVTTVGYGVFYKGIHVESESQYSIYIEGKKNAEIKGLYQQYDGNIRYDGALKIEDQIYFVGNYEVPGSPKDRVIGGAIDPPTSPNTGDKYVIWNGVNYDDTFTATGVWAGNENKIAEWSGSAWNYSTPIRPFDSWYILGGVNDSTITTPNQGRYDFETGTWWRNYNRGGGLLFIEASESKYNILSSTNWEGEYIPSNVSKIGQESYSSGGIFGSSTIQIGDFFNGSIHNYVKDAIRFYVGSTATKIAEFTAGGLVLNYDSAKEKRFLYTNNLGNVLGRDLFYRVTRSGTGTHVITPGSFELVRVNLYLSGNATIQMLLPSTPEDIFLENVQFTTNVTVQSTLTFDSNVICNHPNWDDVNKQITLPAGKIEMNLDYDKDNDEYRLKVDDVPFI